MQLFTDCKQLNFDQKHYYWFLKHILVQCMKQNSWSQKSVEKKASVGDEFSYETAISFRSKGDTGFNWLTNSRESDGDGSFKMSRHL